MATTHQSPPRKGRRNSFQRTKVPFSERVASIAVILLLCAIGLAIWKKGRRFDPHLYSLRTEALKTTAEPATPTDSTGPKKTSEVPQAAASDHGSAEYTDVKSTTTVQSAQEALEISGATPLGKTEFYSAENLYEKIDGRAPAYIGFHFQQLRCRSFSVAAGSFVDVFEFKMATPLDAFGIFSLERDPKGEALDFASDGYSGELGFYFRVGQHYVQIIASDREPKTIELAQSIAQNRAQTLPANDTGLAARRRLPSEGLLDGSVRFVPENAQGQSFLKEVFEASYGFNGTTLPFFIMVADPTEAAGAFDSFRKFCGRFGGKVTPLPDSAGAHLFQAENFGTWKIIFERSGELGGVYDAPDAAKALQFVQRYLQQKPTP